MKKLLILAGIILCSTFANAGHISCDATEIAAFHTGSTGCAIGHENNDKLNPTLSVNDDLMFGHNDWNFGMKFDYDTYLFESGLIGFETPYFGSFGVTGKQASSLMFSDVLEDLFPNADDIMIVLKSGNGNTTQSNYIGYTLDLTLDTFTWDTPFFNPDENGLGNPKDLSHWSLYGRGSDTFVTTSCVGENCDPVDVPEPGMMGLFALAGAGLLYMRRRKKA